jgi:hypothetical protein
LEQAQAILPASSSVNQREESEIRIGRGWDKGERQRVRRPPTLSKTAAALLVKHGGGSLGPWQASGELVARVLRYAQQVYLRLQDWQSARDTYPEGVELRVVGFELVYTGLGVEQAPALQVKPAHALAG